MHNNIFHIFFVYFFLFLKFLEVGRLLRGEGGKQKIEEKKIIRHSPDVKGGRR
jgi:hypothetical protein